MSSALRKVKDVRIIEEMVRMPTVKASTQPMFLRYVLHTNFGLYLGPPIISREGDMLVAETIIPDFDFRIDNVFCMDTPSQQIVRAKLGTLPIHIKANESVCFSFHFNFAEQA